MITRVDMERALSDIEFPGEDEALVASYLRTTDLADRVLIQTRTMRIISRRHLIWTIFAVLMVVTTIAFGLNPTFRTTVAGGSSWLMPMTYGLLGIVLLLGLTGWALTLDPVRVDQLMRRTPPAGRPS